MPLERLVGNVVHLFSPPEVLVRLRHAVENEYSTAETVSAIVRQDPNLSARILRMANSPIYGSRRQVDTVSRAVSLIGMRDLVQIATAIFVVQSLGGLQSTTPGPAAFWRHCVFTGILAQGIARHARVLHPERLFVAGLLHDIGVLILQAKLPREFGIAWNQSGGDEQGLAQSERALLGYDHGEVGAALLDHWGLPGVLCDAIADHHAALKPPSLDAAIVMLADRLANAAEDTALGQAPSPFPEDIVWESTGLPPGLSADILEAGAEGLSDVLSLLIPNG